MSSHYVKTINSIIGGPFESEVRVRDGDTIVAETAPGCWGPMITPRVFGGHEVTGPVWLEGAMPGDAVAIRIQKVEILSSATASGTGKTIQGFYDRDPSVKAICPYCGIDNPDTYLEGIGESSIRCRHCGKPIIPQTFDNGYTIICQDDCSIAVSIDAEAAEEIAAKTLKGEMYLPEDAKQHPATILGRADFSNLLIRRYPMVGNIGCSPAKRTPASKNAGDYFLSISKTGMFEALAKNEINDAHMDIKSVGEGCVVISPVLVPGAGIYVGDVHLTQGDGEIAGHTLDVSARVTFDVSLIKNLHLEGPVMLPAVEELDRRFLPFSEEEYQKANKLLAAYGKRVMARNYPIQIVGSGTNMNEGLENAFDRAEKLTGLCRGELMNRATVGGEIGIGRTSGLVYLTLMLEEDTLNQMGILEPVRKHYA